MIRRPPKSMSNSMNKTNQGNYKEYCANLRFQNALISIRNSQNARKIQLRQNMENQKCL